MLNKYNKYVNGPNIFNYSSIAVSNVIEPIKKLAKLYGLAPLFRYRTINQNWKYIRSAYPIAIDAYAYLYFNVMKTLLILMAIRTDEIILEVVKQSKK